jgi:hypothetical protein
VVGAQSLRLVQSQNYFTTDGLATHQFVLALSPLRLTIRDISETESLHSSSLRNILSDERMGLFMKRLCPVYVSHNIENSSLY